MDPNRDDRPGSASLRIPKDPRVGFLPASLKGPLATSELEESIVGRLGTRIYRFRDRASGSRSYLKVAATGSDDSLTDEHHRLLWLQDRLPVPRILGYQEWDTWVALWIAELPGSPASDPRHSSETRAVVLLAELLSSIHSLNIDSCPFRDVLDRDLREAERRIRSGALNHSLFARHANGRRPQAVFDELVATRGIVRETEFTHGDYCMPNVILNDGRPSGVIDWAQAGVGDPSRDLMAMIESIERNSGPGRSSLFIETYGPDRVSPERIRYFALLDLFHASDSD